MSASLQEVIQELEQRELNRMQAASFHLVDNGVLVIGGEGGYFAHIGGSMIPAVSDRARGLGEDGFYHFHIDNPLG